MLSVGAMRQADSGDAANRNQLATDLGACCDSLPCTLQRAGGARVCGKMVKPGPAQRTPLKNNPWEILVAAGLFFFPGVVLLFQREPIIAFQQSFRWAPSGATGVTPHGAHVFGLLAIAVSLMIVWLYFRVRGEIRRDANAGPRH